MDLIDYAVKQLVDDKADHAFIRSCLTPDTDLFEFYNALALRIASLFMEESMSFNDADAKKGVGYIFSSCSVVFTCFIKYPRLL